MSGICTARLKQERKRWRREHPAGFTAKPRANADGTKDLMQWDCAVPGREGTAWAGSTYPVSITFTADYPSLPPRCSFPEGFFHPNIYPSGTVCLSILDAEIGWKPTITVKQMLLGIQDLLDDPNPDSPANREAYQVYTSNRVQYQMEVAKMAKKYRNK